MKLSDFNADLNEVQWIPMTFNRSPIECTCISYECKWSEMSVWNFNEFQVFEKIFDCTFTKYNDLFNVFYESLPNKMIFYRCLKDLEAAQSNSKVRLRSKRAGRTVWTPKNQKNLQKPMENWYFYKPVWTMNGKRVFHVFICIIYMTCQKLPI